ncbi:sugar phosphate isomerase/epimerase [Candidatus Gracilibacteria bacterium]|nr:sugar phosphate isomerase/epimerase [Candidatus Gracilibacteria bacterium]
MALHYPIAFSTLACPDWRLERVAAAAVEYGYNAIEMRTLDGVVVSSELLTHELLRIRTVLRAHELQLIGIGASTRFASPDAAERAAQGAELRRLLEVASALEVPLVRTFGGVPPIGTSDQDAAGYVVAGLEPLLADAERLGVQIALETHDAFSRGALVAMVLMRCHIRSSRGSGIFCTRCASARRLRRPGSSSGACGACACEGWQAEGSAERRA